MRPSRVTGSSDYSARARSKDHVVADRIVIPHHFACKLAWRHAKDLSPVTHLRRRNKHIEARALRRREISMPYYLRGGIPLVQIPD